MRKFMFGFLLAGLGVIGLASPASAQRISATGTDAAPVIAAAPVVAAAPLIAATPAIAAAPVIAAVPRTAAAVVSSRLASVSTRSVSGIVDVDGARYRTRPVNGQVVGLLYRYTWMTVHCERRASDGKLWGFITTKSGRVGWMHEDLYSTRWEHTAPGGTGQVSGGTPRRC